MIIIPLLFVATELYSALRIPHRDRLDIVCALTIVPSELFAWLRSGWFIAAWAEVLLGKITGNHKDHWRLQYAAEAQ